VGSEDGLEEVLQLGLGRHEVVGSLVEQLNRPGELDDTVIIFQSDNGFLHGEHGIFDKDVPWDRSVRVPLIIRGPGFGAADVRRDITANVDVPATILDLANAEPPKPPDGYSLLDDHHRKFLLLERLVTTNDHKKYPWLEIKTAKGMTYWRDLRGGHQHLYDLDSDQWQARNLAKKKPGIVKVLDKRARRVRHCADPCP
jgi:arylsulfatase A-like enzyme